MALLGTRDGMPLQPKPIAAILGKLEIRKMLNTNVTRLMTLSASVLLAFAATSASAGDGEKTTSVHATPAAAQPAKPATLRDKDLEHNMVQGEGVDHPREILKDGKAKKPAAKAAPRKATQRDLDLKHDMVQGDGVDHPREIIKK